MRKNKTKNHTKNRWDEIFSQSDPKLLEAMEEFERGKTTGDRLADAVADIAGSWWFILSFCAMMLAWIAVNTYNLYVFDKPPFVLLNLVLSTIAALQAPIILMSHRRQADKERLRRQHEYLVNLETSRQLQSTLEQIEIVKAMIIENKHND